jgi:endonuclease/exonuclease/phosphatase (EEP) superfamily protein YafD
VPLESPRNQRYSKDLKCVDARVLRKGISDHFPLLAMMVK